MKINKRHQIIIKLMFYWFAIAQNWLNILLFRDLHNSNLITFKIYSSNKRFALLLLNINCHYNLSKK